jgi:hypothetical protein
MSAVRTAIVLFIIFYTLFLIWAFHEDITVGGHTWVVALEVFLMLLAGAALIVAVMVFIEFAWSSRGRREWPQKWGTLRWLFLVVLFGGPLVVVLVVPPFLDLLDLSDVDQLHLQVFVIGCFAAALSLVWVVPVCWYLVQFLKKERADFFARLALAVFVVSKTVHLVLRINSAL